ncbi:hypothetical protein D8S78_01365 [Natrialba swarupiae]|nr:hypothetical protein [Natrialba swarupiae]
MELRPPLDGSVSNVNYGLLDVTAVEACQSAVPVALLDIPLDERPAVSGAVSVNSSPVRVAIRTPRRAAGAGSFGPPGSATVAGGR